MYYTHHGITCNFRSKFSGFFTKFIVFSHQVGVLYRKKSVCECIRSQLSRSEPDLYLNEEAGTHQQAAHHNIMCRVQKTTYSTLAANGWKTSTRGVDFILQQIVLRVALH